MLSGRLDHNWHGNCCIPIKHKTEKKGLKDSNLTDAIWYFFVILTKFARRERKEMSQTNPRIMIVESFGSNMKSLSSRLSGFPLPLEIVSATDAASALSRLQREAIDLVVVDSCLRGKTDGFELCRTLKASLSHNQIPIILLLSGYLSLERVRGISPGADLLLHRPIVKEELLRMMQLLLGWRFEESVNARLPTPENRALRRLRSA